MKGGKFNTIGPDGFENLKQKSHIFSQSQILPGRIDINNNFIYPINHTWPAELTYILKPTYREYLIDSELNWSLFTNKNKLLEKYIKKNKNIYCEISHLNSNIFLLSNFGGSFEQFLQNDTSIVIYISITRYNNLLFPWRESLIFIPSDELIENLHDLNLMFGTIEKYPNKTYKFKVISNLQLWYNSPNYRTPE